MVIDILNMMSRHFEEQGTFWEGVLTHVIIAILGALVIGLVWVAVATKFLVPTLLFILGLIVLFSVLWLAGMLTLMLMIAIMSIINSFKYKKS